MAVHAPAFIERPEGVRALQDRVFAELVEHRVLVAVGVGERIDLGVLLQLGVPFLDALPITRQEHGLAIGARRNAIHQARAIEFLGDRTWRCERYLDIDRGSTCSDDHHSRPNQRQG
ncbi:MAG: hypothetical protein ACLGHG_06850 [Gammaproteobacteria bacterium]